MAEEEQALVPTEETVLQRCLRRFVRADQDLDNAQLALDNWKRNNPKHSLSDSKLLRLEQREKDAEQALQNANQRLQNANQRLQDARRANESWIDTGNPCFYTSIYGAY